MMKKIGVFATMAIVATAFAVPAMASASNWKDHGTEITSNAVIPVSGNYSYTGSLGGFSCATITGSITLEPGSTGKITSFTPTLSSCHDTGGLSGCTITAISVENLPWVIHDLGTSVSVTGVKITHKFSGFLCPSTWVFSGNGMVLTPDNTSAIHSFTLGGELEASVGGNVTVAGSFTPTNASDSGTYGL